MKKNAYLGIDCTGKYCCILKTFLSFKQMSENAKDIEASDFLHESTNWNGRDEVKRTLKIKNWKIDHCIILPQPIIFSGSDYDTGYEYPWTFVVASIAEVVKKMEGDNS